MKLDINSQDVYWLTVLLLTLIFGNIARYFTSYTIFMCIFVFMLYKLINDVKNQTHLPHSLFLMIISFGTIVFAWSKYSTGIFKIATIFIIAHIAMKLVQKKGI